VTGLFVPAEASLTSQTIVDKACDTELTGKEASGFHADPYEVKNVEETFPEYFRCRKTNHFPENLFLRKVPDVN